MKRLIHKYKAFVFLFFFFSFFSQSLLSAEYNLSQTYSKIFSSQEPILLEQNDLEEFKDVQIVLIPGSLPKSVLRHPYSIPRLSMFLGDRFVDALRYFHDDLQLDTVRLNVISKNPEVNTQIVYEKLVSSYEEKKKLFIVAHCLGGISTIDALEKFLKNYPDGLSIIHGIIFMQSPLFGPPLADLVYSEKAWVRMFSKFLLSLSYSNPSAINLLRPSEREKAMDRQQGIIDNLIKDHRILYMASYVSGKTALAVPRSINLNGRFSSLMKHPLIYDGFTGLNDGLVPLWSTMIPNSPYVIIEEMDHSLCCVANRVPPNVHVRARVVEALMKVFFMEKRKYSY